MLRFPFLCALALTVPGSFGVELKEEFSWKELSFDWPSEDFKANALKTNSYIPENNLALGLAVWKDKVFVTVPRFKAGVASSLNYVTIGSDKSSALKPYPSWEANYIPAEEGGTPAAETSKERNNAAAAVAPEVGLEDNSTIVSAFRLWTDKCERLWVMDAGLTDNLGSAKQVVRPSLVIFDLNNDSLLRRYFFKDSDIKPKSFFSNVVIDADSCEDSFAYVPDLGAYGLVVYSLKQNNSWRVKHHYFHFDPLAGEYKVGPVSFQWTDGVFGLALSGKHEDGSRNVIFHAFSSTKEFQVSNVILQNETWATSPDNFHDFKFIGERGPNSQASVNYFDEKSGVLFYTQVNRDGIACWNSKKPLSPETTALFVKNAQTLEFPNDLKIDNNGTLWILSDRLPRFLYQSLDSDDTNYRIFTIPVEDAIKDSVCA